jgi:hypothetical protein
LIATADLRYIGLAPQPATHESRRNPGGFHTAVWDLCSSETLTGTSWSKALARHGADAGVALAGCWGGRRGYSG